MKNYLLPVVFVSLLMVINACRPDPTPDPTAAELQLEKLTGSYNSSSSKTWTTSSVMFDGSEDRTDDWNGFSLTISTSGTLSNNSYSTAGAVSPGPWPSSGSWSFGGTEDNPNINQVVRNDGLEIAVNVSGTSLTLTFTFDDSQHSGGRVEAVNGEYIFTLTSN